MDIKDNGKRIDLGSDGKKLFFEALRPNCFRIFSSLHKSDIVKEGFTSPFDFVHEATMDGILIHLPKIDVNISDSFLLSLEEKGKIVMSEIPDSSCEQEDEGDSSIASLEGHHVDEKAANTFSHRFLLRDCMHFYGLGDHPGPFDRLNYEFINYNSDVPSAHEDNVKSLYKSIPFFIADLGDVYLGVYLDNSYRSSFDFGMDGKTFSFGSENGPDDVYYFIGTMKEIVAMFTDLTGRFPLPARWTLGYGQSRWSYESEKKVEEVLKGYKDADIPLTSIYLDIDYMEGYRVFTSSEERFPKFPSFLSNLHKDGYKVVTIIDPGVKEDPGYSVYDEGMKNGYFATYKGKEYVNEVWPGPSLYPAFNSAKVREWWGKKCFELSAKGVDGIWCDMNEPASFKGPLPPDVDFDGRKHDEIHNLYGHYMSRATYEGLKKNGKRPFVITRACFAGTSSYSTVWTGDNQSIWSHLNMYLPQSLNMGLSGMPFVGSDIGGFGGDCPPELMKRWIEVGSFSPLFRNHSAMGTLPQEAYNYDKETQAIYRKWVKNRYSLTPLFYDLFYEHSQNGLPALRPLIMEFPFEKAFANCNTEFMVGESMLVAPVTVSGERERVLTLPEGRWFSFFNPNEQLLGGSYVKKCPDSDCLIYVKAGTIIPVFPEGYYDLDKNPECLELRLFPGEGKYLHYQDAGDGFGYLNGEYNLYEFTNHDGVLSYRFVHQGFEPYKMIKVISLVGISQIVISR